ncbi:hypothetical protein SAMN04488515_0154 [Cognatiyoonia koreensis]|uniref:Uncharacterized protein n=1 Tax=Cognatiyoonia koreensis TaxID=364200 RepID=A0A1I0MQ37_9RHOB|nr:hypothetical protein [Cognatiyoonia koreensis]SEV90366.1 hypothetical protein SAMN04488515_0154 [Cognatiyoonia koreensis]
MRRVIGIACCVLIPAAGHANDAKVDMTALQQIDAAAFVPGNCRVSLSQGPILMFECGEGTNPVIGVFGGTTSDPQIEFAVSPDIAKRCADMGNCLEGQPFAYGDWTGGRYIVDGKFGYNTHIILVSGDAVVEITSRDLAIDVSVQNADIAMKQVGALLLCEPWGGTSPTCPMSQ